MSRRKVEDYSVVFAYTLKLIGPPGAVEFLADFEASHLEDSTCKTSFGDSTQVWLSLHSITVSFHPEKWPATSVQNRPTTEN